MNQEKQSGVSRRQQATLFIMLMFGILTPYLFQYNLTNGRLNLSLYAPLYNLVITSDIIWGIRTRFSLENSLFEIHSLWIIGNIWLLSLGFVYFVYCSIKGTIKRSTAVVCGFVCHLYEIAFLAVSLSMFISSGFQSALLGPFPLLLLIGILIILIEGKESLILGNHLDDNSVWLEKENEDT